MSINLIRLTMLLTMAGTLFLGASFRASAAPRIPWARTGRVLAQDRPGNRLGLHGAAPRGQHPVGSSVPTSGTVNILFIKVSFQPDTDTHTTGTGLFPYNVWGPTVDEGTNYLPTRLQQLKKYFSEVSGNTVNINYMLTQEVQLPKIMSAYTDDLNSNNESRVASILVDATAGANIPVDNYDMVCILHAGCGSEVSVDTGTKDLPSMNVTLSHVQNVAGSARGVESFAILPETLCSDSYFSAANPNISPDSYAKDKTLSPVVIPHYWDVVGVWAHEIAHGFGLPDLYNTSTTSSGVDLGVWTLMSTGAYLPQPTGTNASSPWSIPHTAGETAYGSQPAHLDAWSKKLLGWGTIHVISNLTYVTIPAASAGKTDIYQMWTDGDTTSSEYFLLENRELLNFDQALPEAGLMIYHIDDAVGTLVDNNVQQSTTHPRIFPLSADNTLEQEKKNSVAIFDYEPITDTPFPGNEGDRHVGKSTTDTSGNAIPNTRSYTGADTGVDINNISLVGNNVVVDLTTALPASMTFIDPAQGSTLYVSRPSVRIALHNIDNPTVTVNGQSVTATVAGGILSFTDTGLLPGNYQVQAQGKDHNFGGAVAASLSFTVAQKQLPAGISMIALPVMMVGDAPAVFAGQSALMLANRLKRWDASKHTYLSYPDIDLYAGANDPAWAVFAARTQGDTLPLAPAGLAYWVNFPTANMLRLDGDHLSNTASYEVPVTTGFNMIGNPFNYAIAWTAVQVEYAGQTFTMDAAIQKKLIDPALYSWDSADHQYGVAIYPQGSFTPWVGYWLYVRADCSNGPMRLLFSPAATRTAARVVTAPARTAGTAANWLLGLRAVTATGTSRSSLIVGVSTADSSILAPPTSPVGIALVSLATGGTPMMRDYRAPSAGTYSWTVQVSGDPGAQIVLSWPDLTQLPRGYQAVLHDLTAGQQWYLHTSPSCTVALGVQESRRQLTLEIKRGAVGSLQIQGIQVTHTRGAVAVNCLLTQSAQVTMEMRSITGRLLKRQLLGACAQGRVALNWDGKDGQNRTLPPGTYQCQLTAVAPDGQSAKAVTLVPF